MRSLVLIGAMLLLGGCNMVMTTQPMFSKADEAGAPRLKPGVWTSGGDASCPLDEKTPMATWPKCADGVVIGDGAIMASQTVAGRSATSTIDFVMAAGNPRVLQLHGIEMTPGSGLTLANYFYGALRPTKTDAQGMITGYTGWIVSCGPPSPPATDGAGGKPLVGTNAPLPGMTMEPDGQNCTAASPAAIRNAAAASEKWSSSTSASHWVRDGEK